MLHRKTWVLPMMAALTTSAGTTQAEALPDTSALSPHPERVLLQPGECGAAVTGEHRLRWFCAEGPTLADATATPTANPTDAPGIEQSPMPDAPAETVKLEAELAEARQGLEAANRENETLRGQFAAAVAEGRETTSALREEVAALQQQLAGNAAERDELRARLSATQGQLDDALSEQARIREAGVTAQQESDRQLEDVQAQLVAARAARDALQTRLDVATEETQARVAELSQQIGSLEAQVAEAQAAGEAQRARLDEARGRLEAERTERSQLQQAFDETRGQLEAERTERSRLQRAFDETRGQLEAERTERSRLQQAFDETRSQLEAERTKASRLRQDFAETRSRLEQDLGAMERELSVAIDASRRLQSRADALAGENLETFARNAELLRQVREYEALLGDRDRDGVVDPLDLCTAAFQDSAVDRTGCAVGEAIVLQGVSFASNSTVLTGDSRQVLDQLAQRLSHYAELRFEIGGHTDNSGSAEYNREISEERAKAVKDYLVSRGVAAGRLEVRGYGQDRPIADNTEEAGRALNRRVSLLRLE